MVVSTSTRRRALTIGCAVAELTVLAALLPVRAGLASFAAWARGAGPAGALGFALAQVACTLLLVPAWPLRVAAGFVWGAAGGFAVAMPSSLAASVLAFLMGRRVLRERIASRVAREPRLSALDDAVAESGFWIVLLLRLSPVFPNELVNYGLGLTRVRLRDYALASCLGMIPATATYVWVGSLVTAAADLARGRPVVAGPLGQAVGVGGLLATVAIAVVSTRLARRALDRRQAAGERRPALLQGAPGGATGVP